MHYGFIRVFYLSLFGFYGSLMAMDNQVTLECSDGNIIHVNQELIKDTPLGFFLTKANKPNGYLHDTDSRINEPEQAPIQMIDNNHPLAGHFTAAHMEQFFTIMANHEQLSEIEDIHELESCLVIGDFLSVQNNILRSISLRTINICHKLAILHPHVKDIMMMSMRNYLIRQDDGTFHLDLHNQAGEHADSSRLFRESIKIISLFDHETRQQISSIDLRHNQLTELNIQELIRLTPNLKNFDLSHNNLRQFHATLPRRFSLDISHNQLETLTLENAQQDHIRLNCSHNYLNYEVRRELRNTLEQKSFRDYLALATRGVMGGLRTVSRSPGLRHFVKRTALIIGAGYLYKKIISPKIISKICSPLLRKLPQRWLKRLALAICFGSTAYHGVEAALNIASLRANHNDIIALASLYINGSTSYLTLLLGLGFSQIKSNNFPIEGASILLPHFVAIPVWKKFQPSLEHHVIDPIIGLTDPATAHISRRWDHGINALEQFTVEHQNLHLMDPDWYKNCSKSLIQDHWKRRQTKHFWTIKKNICNKLLTLEYHIC